MAVHDVSDCNVYISTDGTNGSYTALSEATGFARTADSEGNTTVRTFGGGRHVRSGDDVDSYDISALVDWDAQSDIRDAKHSGNSIWIAVIVDDTTGSEVGTDQECKIITYNVDADADGDFARFSFTAEGEGDLSEITSLPSSST